MNIDIISQNLRFVKRENEKIWPGTGFGIMAEPSPAFFVLTI